jgi:hypothetical protein
VTDAFSFSSHHTFYFVGLGSRFLQVCESAVVDGSSSLSSYLLLFLLSALELCSFMYHWSSVCTLLLLGIKKWESFLHTGSFEIKFRHAHCARSAYNKCLL